MTKYVVTGAAGFIGSHIAETLVRKGGEVVAVDNLFTGKKENLKHLLKDLRFVKADIRDTDKMQRHMRGTDAVFHLAAIPSVPRSVAEPVITNEVNVGGTLSVLKAALDAGVRRVVYSSSSSAYGDSPRLPKVETMKPEPLSPYAAQKLMGEYYARIFNDIYGLETVSLRYFNVFGPRQDPKSQYAAVVPKFITLLASSRPPVIFGNGKQSRDFTYIDNVVDANLLAAKAPKTNGKVVNIACGERTTVNELARLIAKIMGKNIGPVYKPARKGDVLHSLAGIALAKKTLGYKPAVSLEDGLKKTVEFFTRSSA
jgi:nucleoside-diphosphate-sugar epimerase